MLQMWNAIIIDSKTFMCCLDKKFFFKYVYLLSGASVLNKEISVRNNWQSDSLTNICMFIITTLS